MQNKKTIDSLSEKEKQEIIKIGKSADILNKYGIKISAVPVCIGIALIILGATLDVNMSMFLLGMALLVGGFLITIIWGFSVASKEKRCNYYSNELYQELLEIKTTNSIIFEPDESLYPLTTNIAKEKFAGNVNEAVKYIILNIRGEELDKYIDEWTPEQAAYALDYKYSIAKETIGDEKVKETFSISAKLNEFNMDEEDVITKPNPFIKKLVIHLIVLGVLIVLSVVFTVVQNSNSIIGEWYEEIIEACTMASPAIVSLEALDIGIIIVKLFKFKRLKKQLVLQKKESDNT